MVDDNLDEPHADDEEFEFPFADEHLDAWRVPTPAPDLAQRVLEHVETKMTTTMTNTEAPTPISMSSASTPIQARGRPASFGMAMVGVAMVAAAALVLGLVQWWKAPPLESSSAAVAAPAAATSSSPTSVDDPSMAVERAALVLEIEPPDASVRIDGKPVAGPSPFSVTGLTAGPHRLVIERDGYLPFSRVLEGGRPLTLPVQLARRDVVLVLSVEPSDATVTLWADDAATTIEEQRHSLRRESGVRYEIEAEAPGHVSRRIPLAFGDAADVPVSLSLAPDPDEPSSEPSAASSPSSSGRSSSWSGSGSPDLKDPFARRGGSSSSTPKAVEKATLRVGPKPGSPPGKVYVDGRHVGNIPILNIKVKPGSRRVKVDFGARGVFKTTMRFKSGETKTLMAGPPLPEVP